MQNDLDLNNHIVLSNVGLVYPIGAITALHDVNIAVNAGEFVCLIGPSGSGKSTILTLIAGLIKPTSGIIKRPENVSVAFQGGALFPWLTVYQNAAFGLEVKKFAPEKIKKEVDQYLELLRINHLAEKFPSELSGGERQRVGIARALSVSPSVLLLDEPFSALDPKTTAELHDDIIHIWQKTQKTIIMISHLIEEAVSLANRVILIKNGTSKAEYKIEMPYPRREQEAYFFRKVSEIRKDFFASS